MTSGSEVERDGVGTVGSGHFSWNWPLQPGLFGNKYIKVKSVKSLGKADGPPGAVKSTRPLGRFHSAGRVELARGGIISSFIFYLYFLEKPTGLRSPLKRAGRCPL